MPEFKSYECNECGDRFTALRDANAAQEVLLTGL